MPAKPIKYKVPYTETPNEVHTIPTNELDILADDGRTLFTLRVLDDGALIVKAGSVAKHDEVMLSEQMTIQPCDARRIKIQRIPYTVEGAKPIT